MPTGDFFTDPELAPSVDNPMVRVTRTITFPANTPNSVVQVEVATVDDERADDNDTAAEAHGSLLAEIVANSEIESNSSLVQIAAAPENMREVRILDNDIPIMNILSASTTVTEGEDIVFEFEVDPLPRGQVGFQVDYVVTPSEADFFTGFHNPLPDEGDINSRVLFEAAVSNATLRIPIVEDDIAEGDASLEVIFTVITRFNGIDPSVRFIGVDSGITQLRRTVAILDNDLVVGITVPDVGKMLSVNENVGSVELALNIEPPVDRELLVDVRYTGDVGALTGAPSSDMVDDMQRFVTVPANTSSHRFTVTVMDDEIAAESDRTANIMVESGDSYVAASAPDNSVALVIEDNDVAQVSFTRSTSTVTEGEQIKLIVTQDLAVDTNTAIDINFIYGGEFFTAEQMAITSTRVEFPVGVAMSTQTIVIDTMDDAVVEDDGFLQAVLKKVDDSPLLPSGPTTSTVTILDDESVVSIGIPGGGNKIVVGEDAGSVTLVLSIDPPVDRELLVNVRYSDDVGALDGTLSEVQTPDRLRVITVPAGITSQILTTSRIFTTSRIYTTSQTFTEISISTTVQTLTAVQILTTSQVFAVLVVDDDIFAESTRTATISIEAGDGYTRSTNNTTVSLGIKDDDEAIVSFSQDIGGTVTEGEDIELIVTQNLVADTNTAVIIEFIRIGISEFFVDTLSPRRVEFPVGVAMSTRTIVIRTDDDAVVEGNGLLLATITVPDEYAEVLSAPRPGDQRTITILDNEPVVSITVPGGEDRLSVNENIGSVTLELNINPPTDRELSVNLLYTEDVGALDGILSSVPTPNRPRVVTVREGITTHMFTIPVIDDDIFAEGTRTATIELAAVEAGDGYTRSVNRTVSLGIKDDDVATVSFSQSEDTITEGEEIEWIITQNLAPNRDIVVNIDFGYNGNFFTPEQRAVTNTQVVFPAGIAMNTYTETIQTTVDTEFDQDGSWNATIRPNSGDVGGGVLEAVTPSVRSVTILDDDVIVGITTADTQGNNIVESDNIRLQLTLDGTLSRDLPVNLSYAGPDESASPLVVIVPAGSQVYGFIASIDNRIAAQPIRNVIISVADGSLYRLSGSDADVNFVVTDDDTAMVSISPVNDAVEEGEFVVFEVSLDIETAVTAFVMVSYTLENTGPFIFNDTVPSVLVTFAPGEISKQVDVGTDNNANRDPNGTVIATLEDPINLAIDSANASTSVTILDRNLFVSITRIEDDPAAVVLESSDVRLRLSLSERLDAGADNALDVNLGYAGDILTLGPTSVTIPGGQREHEFTVSGLDDRIAVQPIREVIVSVATGDDYTVSDSSNEVRLEVMNDDIAMVSISPVRDAITEGDDAVFEVTLNIETAVAAAISIEFAPAEFTGNGRFFDVGDLVPVVETFAAGKTSVLVTVPTIDNNFSALDTSLIAFVTGISGSELQPSNTDTEGSATIMILDDASKVSVTTLGGRNSIQVSEGVGSVRLQLNIIPANVSRDLQVNVLYSGDVGGLTGNFTSDNVPDISAVVTVPANNRSYEFSVPVVDDRIAAELIRRATVSVRTGLGYQVEGSSVEIAVEDNESSATVSISAVNDLVLEDNEVVFEITKDLDLDTTQTGVGITLTEALFLQLDYERSSGYYFDLILPVLTEGGKLYYFLERRGIPGDVTGSPPTTQDKISGRSDRFSGISAFSYEIQRNIFNGRGSGTEIEATQPRGHDGTNDARSVVIETVKEGPAPGSPFPFDYTPDIPPGERYTLIMPTADEYIALYNDLLLSKGKGTPPGWSTDANYCSATQILPVVVGSEPYFTVDMANGTLEEDPSRIEGADRYSCFIAVQVIHPIELTFSPGAAMSTIRRTVPTTFTGSNALTRDSVVSAQIHRLPSSTAPLQLSSQTRSTVNVLDDDVEVSIELGAGVSDNIVTEGGMVSLQFAFSYSINEHQVPREVNLSYADASGPLGEPFVVEVPAGGGNSYAFEVPVLDDEIAGQSDRNVDIVVMQGVGYRVGNDFSETLRVMDNDIVLVSIAPVKDVITEGDFAVFRVTLDQEIANQAGVQVEFSSDNDFFENFFFGFGFTNTKLLTFNPGDVSREVSVGTQDDPIRESDGAVSARLVSISGSTLMNFAVDSGRLTILDNDSVVSITTNRGEDSMTISESDNIDNIVLQLNIPNPVARPLQVTLSYAGNPELLELLGEPLVVEVPANMTEHEFRVPVINDMIAAQSNRNIRISVGAGPGYTASPNPVSITVMDDDTAMVSISPVSAEVEEGNPVVFEVTLNIETAVAARVEVRYTPVNTRPFVLPADLDPAVVTFAPGDTSEQVSIETFDNTNPDPDGMVTATLENPINLAIDFDNESASVRILDNELLVSIVTLADEASSVSAAVSESDDVRLRLMFSKATNRNVQVNLGYEGLFDESLGLVSVVEVLTGVQEHQFSVLGINDDIAVQPPRTVSVRVNDGVGYSVLAGASSVELTVTNEDFATVSISPITGTIQEGDKAIFEISLNRKTATSVVAGIRFKSQNNVFVPDEISVGLVNARFEAGQTTTRVEIQTQNNNNEEGDGILSALIDLAEGSPLLGNGNSADVTILDGDAIVSVTIPGEGDSIEVPENVGSVELQLDIPDIIRMRNQAFDVTLRYTGDVGALTGEFSSVRVDDISIIVTVPASALTHRFDIPVTNDMIAAESDRTARIVVDSGFGYAGSPDSVAITIMDDEDDATVTIEPVSPSVTEGDTIIFKVIRNLAMDKATSVQLELAHNGDFFFAASNDVSGELIFPQRNNLEINPRLLHRHKRDGRLYYFLDDFEGQDNVFDSVGLGELRRTFNNDGDVNSPIMATQEDGHDGSDDSRSTIFEDINEQKYALVLPTLAEIITFFTNDSGNLERNIPSGWQRTAPTFLIGTNDPNNRVDYWSATPDANMTDRTYVFDFGSTEFGRMNSLGRISGDNAYVFLQVLAPPRTINVILPAEQSTMDSVLVEVPTFDIHDSIVNGSLTAELVEPGDSLALGNLVTSEVEILHNDAVVTVALSATGDPTATLNEGESVDLRLSVISSVARDRELSVGLSYVNIVTGMTEMVDVVSVPSNVNQSAPFSITVPNDDIAVQPRRSFNVMVEPGLGYRVGDPSAVTIIVENDDLATVSIESLTDQIEEGQSARFEVQVDNEIAVDLTVRIDLALATSEEDFGIPTAADVVIAAGTTTALLTVITDDDVVQEADGLLTATIDMLIPMQQVDRGPAISDTNNSATAMILDDDLVVTVATLADQTSITVSEAVGNVMLRLMFSADIDRPLPVSLNYADDSGLLGTSPSFVVNVDANADAIERQFTVPINNDLIVAQPDRNIDVSVVTGANYTAPLDFVRITVTDDDRALVSIMPVNSTIVQSESAEFDVVLTHETAIDIDIDIDVEFGQIQGSSGTTVTVPKGQTRTLLTVPTVDNTVSSTMVATLRGTSHSALTIGTPSSATVAILDNLVVGIQVLNESGFTSASTVVSEAVGDVILQLDFTPAVSRPIEVELTYTGDIRFLNSVVSSLEIPVNTTSTMTTLRVTNDLIALQPDRNINIAVFDGQGYTVSSTSSAVNLAITDDDSAQISISSSPSVIEEGSDAEFELTLSKETAIDVSARISFTPSGSVFLIPPMNTIVTFTAGETTRFLSIATDNDERAELDGSLLLSIEEVSDPRLELGVSMSSVSILDNDAEVRVIWGNNSRITSVGEGASTENLIFNISDPVNRALDLKLRYSGDPGALTGEFSADSTTVGRTVDVEIPANETFIEFPVVIIDDKIAGEETRTVIISVLNAFSFGYKLGVNPTVELRVVDDDIARVSISPTVDAVTEGTTVTFTVTQDLDADIETRFDIGLSPTNDFFNSPLLSTTGAFRNSNSSFFVSNTSNTLTVAFPAGPVTRTFTYEVDTVNDEQAESDGLLVSTLHPTGLLETDSSISSITILDDDSKVGITSLNGGSETTVSEDDGSVTLQLNIDPPTDHALNVNLLYTGDLKALLGVLYPPTDSSGREITEMSTIVTVPAGNSTHLFDITIRDDAFAEFDDEVQVTVQAGDNYQVTDVANSTEVVTIIEDDDDARVSIKPVTNPVTEGSTIVFVITRNLITEEPTSITLVLSPTGAVFDANLSGRTMLTINFPANELDSTHEVPVQTVDDGVIEAHGSLFAELISMDENSLSQPAAAPDNASTVTILDNDIPVMTITSVPSSVTEGVDIVFEFELSLPVTSGMLSFMINLSESVVSGANFVTSAQLGMTTVTFSAPNRMSMHTVPTLNDNVVEEDGSLVAIFMPVIRTAANGFLDTEGIGLPEIRFAGVSEDIGTLERRVAIEDNEPNIRITSLENEATTIISEADGGATFLLTLSPAPDRFTFDVALEYTDESNILGAGARPFVRVSPSGGVEYEFNVPVADDDIAAQPLRDIRISVVQRMAFNNRQYTVSPAYSAATLTVIDEDIALAKVVFFTLEGISLIEKDTTETEGTDLNFQVILDREIATSVSVGINVKGQGDFFKDPEGTGGFFDDDFNESSANESSFVLTIPAGRTTSAVVEIPTFGDDDDEANGSLRVEITPFEPLQSGKPTSITVTILDNDQRTIGLNLIDLETTVLSIARFSTTRIEVSADTGGDLTVDLEGEVISITTMNYSLAAGVPERLEFEGLEEGEGTITFTISGGEDATPEELVWRVIVTRPVLEISATVENIRIEARTTVGFTVNVSAVGGHNVTLTATVVDAAGADVTDVVAVSPTLLRDISVSGSKMFTVTGLGAGDVRLLIMASRPDYDPGVVEIPVEGYLPAIGLSVGTTSLTIVQTDPNNLRRNDGRFTVEVSADVVASTDITITVESNNDNVVRVLTGTLPLQKGDEVNSVTAEVRGLEPGPATLTITATADGYDEETAEVAVLVLDRFRIAADRTAFDLTEGTSTTISIGVILIRPGTSVTIRLTVTEGDLEVSPASLVVRSTGEETVTVSAIDNDEYSLVDRSAVLTLSADGYAAETVRVNILDDELPPIELSVVPASLDIDVREEGIFEVRVNAPVNAPPLTGFVSFTTESEDDRIVGVRTPNLVASGEETANIIVFGSCLVAADCIGEPVTITIKANAAGYAEGTTRVEAVVLDTYRVVTEPNVLNVTEGIAGTFSVGVSRIEYEGSVVTIGLEGSSDLEGFRLSVSSPSLTVSSTVLQDIRVTVDDDEVYIGDRVTTLILTAVGIGRAATEVTVYTTKRFTINVMEDEDQPIELSALPTTVPALMRYAITEIEVSVGVDANLMVETEGAVSLADGTPDSFALSKGTTKIAIVGVDVGAGTVTFIASGNRLLTATSVVSVTVTRPVLGISFEEADGILSIEARTTEGLTVNVNAAGGQPVTVTASLSSVESLIAILPRTKLQEVSESTVLTVAGVSAGNVILTLTASHPEYIDASTRLTVSVYFPPVGLSVTPTSLVVFNGFYELLTVAASESTQTTVEVTSLHDNIASVPQPVFTFMGGEDRSAAVRVNGNALGITTLTITASADGYADDEVTVPVEVQVPFSIAANPTMLSLMEDDTSGGNSGQIDVRLTRIEEDDVVTIDLEGSELEVSSPSLTFTNTDTQTVTVMVVDNDDYDGDRVTTLILTADDYTTETVIVNIREDEDQPIEISVSPTAVNLMSFERTRITVSVDVSARIEIQLQGDFIELVTAADANFDLDANVPREIEIVALLVTEEQRGSRGIIRFIATGDRKAEERVVITTIVTPPEIVAPDVLNVTEGIAETISVGVSQIEAGGGTVTINLEREGLEKIGEELTDLEPEHNILDVIQPLTVNNTELRNVSVMAINDGVYTDDRRTTLILTANNYTTKIVVVNITDPDLRVIGLNIGDETELDLPEFDESRITVSAMIDASLTVETEGTVSLAGGMSSTTYSLTGTLIEIEIRGVELGEGTVTFTASAARATTEMKVLNVNVVPSQLRIIAQVDGDGVFRIEARTTAELTVNVNIPGEDLVGVTVTATIDGDSGVASLPQTVLLGVSESESTVLKVRGLSAGDVTLRLTASHPEYADANTDVTVNVFFPPVGLNVLLSPPEFEEETTSLLTVEVIDSTQATITISSDNPGIASVPSEPFILQGGTDIIENVEVSGNSAGNTTLRIEAVADGYTTGIATVTVRVLDTFRIVAVPATFDLREDGSTQISVSLSRIEAGDDVTVTIKPEGIGLGVGRLSFPLSSIAPEIVTVEVENDEDYDGDRSGTLTLTADGYATETVTVNIMEDDPQPIGLSVDPTQLSILRFERTTIKVSVDTAALLTISAISTVVQLVSEDTDGNDTFLGTLPESFINPGSQSIEILGQNVGRGTVTFSVRTDRLIETTEVMVTVRKPALVITGVSPSAINLATQATAAVTVSVSAEAGAPKGVILTANIDKDNVAAVNPLDRTIDISADTSAIFTVRGLNVAGETTLTLTAEHDDYDSASTTVDVSVYLRQIGLSVEPSPLVIVEEMSEELELSVSANTDVTLTVTVARDGENIISGFDPEYLLSGEMSTEINVIGLKSGDTTLTITAEAVGYTDETAIVSVMVLGILRIEVVPATFDLTEGESTQISVSPNLIRDNVSTVTINIFPTEGTEGLNVTPSSLRFANTDPQTVTVTATSNTDYTRDRTAELLLSADDYAATVVTVNITEDDLQPIRLMVVGETDLNLVRFTSTDITVSVDVATDLTVKAEGTVRLEAGASSEYSLTGDALSQQIQIEAVSVGEGTVTFTVGGARQLRATAVVSVTVITPTLTISASVDELEIEARTTEGLTVTVNVEAGDTDNVTVTTTVMGNTDAVSVESPVGVSVGTPTIFTVQGLDAGNATLTLIASHPLYESASIDVSVRVSLPPVGLSVDPPALGFVIGGPPEELTITTATTATITIDVAAEANDIINDIQGTYPLNKNDNDAIKIEVSGINTGRTTLTITAEADGYTSETAIVNVEVLDSLRIEVDPATFDLEEGSSQIISVRPNLIRGDVSTVTINIDAPEDLTVMPSSLKFTSAAFQTVTVTTDNDEFYTGDRSRILTLTTDADGYTSVTVSVTITDDELPPIGLRVTPPELEIVTGMSTVLTITTATTATITITGGDNIASVPESAAIFTLKGGEVNSMRIPVSGDEMGRTTLMITAEAVGYEMETTSVSVEVLDPLSIEVDLATFDLTEGSSQIISVYLNRIDADRGEVKVMINLEDPDGSGLTVSPTSLTFTAAELQMTVRVTEMDDSFYTDPRIATLTLSADGYTSVTVTVEITDNDPRPPRIDLSVMPTVLDLVISEIAEITVRVSVDASLVIGPIPIPPEVVDLIDPDNGSDSNSIGFNLSAGTSTRIAIVGVGKGMETVTVTANGIGAGAGVPEEIQTVTVTVSTPTLVITGVSPSNINLLTREETTVTVSVRAEVGAPSDVMLIAMIDEDSRVAEVSLLDRTNVGADTTARFIVGDLNVAGKTTLTLTARHPEYLPASIEIPVNVSLRPIELSVTPTSVRFEQGETELLIITAMPTATTITISVDGDAANIINDNDVQGTYQLNKDDNDEIEVEVRGVNIGRTTLTITAEEDGYETERATVSVEVLDILRIEVPDMLTVTEGGTMDISVRLNRIEADNVTVRVTIQLEGSGLTVSESSLTFSSSSLEQSITVETTTDNTYTGDRSATLTLTATDYATTMVMVTILENTPQPQIELNVTPTVVLNLVRFTSTEIEVSVAVDAVLNVGATGSVRLTGERMSDILNLSKETSIRIEIFGNSVGDGEVRVTANGTGDGTGAMEQTRIVSVTVITPTLTISASTTELDIAADPVELTVTVRAAGNSTGITLMAVINDTAVASVMPPTIPDVIADVEEIFTVEGLVTGTATLTLMASHPEYMPADTTITVNVDRPVEALRFRIKVFLEGAQ